MGPTFVVVLSIAAGAATYIATVRAGRRVPAAMGFDSPSGSAAASVAVGTDTAPDGDEHDDTQAEVVDLDAARTATPDPLILPVPPQSDEGLDDGSDVADDAEATTTLAPVIVTAPTIPAPEPGYAYLRVSTQRPSWRDRIAGIIGIAVLLVLGSAAIAFGIYQLGSGINALVQRFLNG
jgi:hypothetical protein